MPLKSLTIKKLNSHSSAEPNVTFQMRMTCVCTSDGSNVGEWMIFLLVFVGLIGPSVTRDASADQ